MSDARSAKYGPSRSLRISKGLSKITLRFAQSFQSTLKQAAPRLRALDSLHDQTLRSLFQSMTSAQRQEAIGQLRQLNNSVGALYVRSLRINQSLRSSRMDFTTPHSCGEPME